MLDMRKKEIRRLAYEFREKCKINKYAIIDLFKECENRGYKLFRYPLGEDQVLGLVMKKDNDIIVYTNSSTRLSREIFTLAHEIGHIILHFNKDNSFCENAQTISNSEVDEKEHEANYFAACLLMPGDEVNRFLDLEITRIETNGLTGMDIAKMMSEFNVSFEMVLNRLESLKMIDTLTKMKLDNQRTILRVGNLIKSVGGNQRLNEITKEIVLPREYLEYAIDNYNNNAVPKQTLINVLNYYRLTMEDIGDKLVEQTEEEGDLDELLGGV